MQGEEFSKIYFCLNPIHLLGTRQGKLFPWHRVCLRGHVGPSRALSLFLVLLGINCSTWNPNPSLHSVHFPFLCLHPCFFIFSFFPLFLPPLLPCPVNGNCRPVGTMFFLLFETSSSPRRGLLNPRHSLSPVLLFCKCVNFMTLKPAVKAKPWLISQWCEVSGKEWACHCLRCLNHCLRESSAGFLARAFPSPPSSSPHLVSTRNSIVTHLVVCHSSQRITRHGSLTQWCRE